MFSKLQSTQEGTLPARRRCVSAAPTPAERDARENHAETSYARVLDELLGPHASIYTQLDARLRACRPEHGDLRALAPCAEVDALLSRVVSIIQADVEEPLMRVALAQRIAAVPELRARAQRVRRSAGLAETAMEQHYSRALFLELQAVREPFAREPAGSLRTALLERCLGLANFPYVRNYRLLTLAELRLLRQPAPPLLLRAAHAARLPLAQRLRFEAELAQLRARAGAQAALAARLSRAQTIAVCGSGPLPVSGLMLHTTTDARVQLIERDADAVCLSRALLCELERLQVIEPGAVEVVHADVGEYTPSAQVVLVASLVDNHAKLELVQRLREERLPLQALLLRSASSLCAELAYEPVDTLQLTDPRLPFVGECAPASDVERRSEQLVCSAREVLNTTELYRPVGRTCADSSWLHSLLVQLRVEDAHARKP